MPLGKLTAFYSSPLEMKYGVFVDYFESVGYYIDVFTDPTEDDDIEFCIVIDYNRDSVDGNISNENTRSQARVKAIEKACEIFNSTKPNPSHKQQSKQ